MGDFRIALGFAEIVGRTILGARPPCQTTVTVQNNDIAHEGATRVMSELANNSNSPQASPVFATTHWSMVIRAGEATSEARDQALSTLCHAYWYPLYVFVRRRGYSSHDAEDLTQGFFVELLRRKDIRGVDARRGRFRSYLLAALKHYLTNDWKHQNRQKRGGGCDVFSFDAETAEAQYGKESASESPEGDYDRSWALSMLNRALKALRAKYVKKGKEALFDALEPFLSATAEGEVYAKIGEKFELNESAVKMAVSRLRKRYGKAVRDEIAATVSEPDQVEEELQALLQALRRSDPIDGET